MHSRAPTRDRLIESAARLFRAKGYHGVGLTEILKAAETPKGSLYHAFPAGKSDLALAAADAVSRQMLGTVARAFETAPDWDAGRAALLALLAAEFEGPGGQSGCPVAAILFDDPANGAFRTRAAAIYDRWQRAFAYHAIRLGEDEARAERLAATLLLALQGAWVLARARGSAAPLRDLA